MNTLVTSGDFLGNSSQYTAGKGVYEKNGKLFASICGKVINEDNTISIYKKNDYSSFKLG